MPAPSHSVARPHPHVPACSGADFAAGNQWALCAATGGWAEARGAQGRVCNMVSKLLSLVASRF